MRVVDHEGLADLAGIEDGLHLPVGGIEATHETDGDELLARLLFGLHDAYAGVGGGGEGFLAEDVLAGFDGRDHVGFVGGPDAADHDGVDVVRGDEFRGAREGRRADPVGDLPGVLGVEVGDGHHPAARDDAVDAFDVCLPHAAGADHSDAQGHGVAHFTPRPMEARYSRTVMALGSG